MYTYFASKIQNIKTQREVKISVDWLAQLEEQQSVRPEV